MPATPCNTSTRPSLTKRVHAAMLGAAVGGDLAMARTIQRDAFANVTARSIGRFQPKPVDPAPPRRGRMIQGSPLPLLDLGFRAYRQGNRRPTPETFAALLKRDPGISIPDYAYDGLHSTQEILREGMHPRLAGLGNAPCGLIAAAMPAVGIFHFADPQRAYLEGVELASVAQPRLGADWAGLCAAAIAAAFEPDADPASVTAHVLSIAHRHHPDLFYEFDVILRQAHQAAQVSQKNLLNWWFSVGCKANLDYHQNWIAYNPLRYVLPLLNGYSSDAFGFLKTVLCGQPGGITEDYNGHQVAAVIAGAIAGALNGSAAFPPDWQRRAARHTVAWAPMTQALTRRLRAEAQTISTIDRLTAQPGEQTANRLHDKILGNMLAGAIGNAMGSPVEGRFYEEIDTDYPGGITTVLQPERLETEDDNQMAMLLTETYLERRGAPVMARHFGKTWMDRLNRQHFFALCMGNAYDRIRDGLDARIAGHWSVVTGSTVMCLEPAGIYNLANPHDAMLDATAIAYMYQRGLDVHAAAGMAAAVAAAMTPDATVDKVITAALKAAPTQRLQCFDQRPFRSFRDYLETCLTIAARYNDVLAVRRELHEKCLLYHMIDPMELWGFALAMFKIANGDVRQAAIGGTNIGRDSDTIAGRAAMLAGTLNGAAAIPGEWIALFPENVLDGIRRNAGRMAELITGPRRQPLVIRQTLGQELEGKKSQADEAGSTGRVVQGY